MERLNKRYVLLLYFYHFIILIDCVCTYRYMHKIILLFFSCIRHVCLTDTTRLSSNCGRTIWQPDVLPTLLNARNSTTRYSHKTFCHLAALGNCEKKVSNHFWDSWTSHFRFLDSQTNTVPRYSCKIMHLFNKGWSLDALRSQLQGS